VTTYRPPPCVCHRGSRAPRPERRRRDKHRHSRPRHDPRRTLGTFRRYIRRNPPTIKGLSMLGRSRRHCRQNLPSVVGVGGGSGGHAADGRPARPSGGTAVTALFRPCANARSQYAACYSVSAE
jgi:hypothetical protein